MTSKTYVALLRGINVGRAKRVAMADLRTLIGGLGFSEVRSVLNSGNVVFRAPPIAPASAASAIEEALVLKLGVVSRVFVLASEELAAIIDGNPLVEQATDHARLLTFILAQPGSGRPLAGLCGQDWTPEALALGDRAAYVWCPDGVLTSAAAAAVGKQLGDTTTTRNWSTLRKLHALCCGEEA
jgi:uncharacterized protein (DUF1697 family)